MNQDDGGRRLPLPRRSAPPTHSSLPGARGADPAAPQPPARAEGAPREVAGPTSTAVSREQVEMAARLANIEPRPGPDSALANQYALRRGAGGDAAVDYQARPRDGPRDGLRPRRRRPRLPGDRREEGGEAEKGGGGGGGAAGGGRGAGMPRGGGGGPLIKEAEIRAAHKKVRDHFATRFTEVRRGSGYSTRTSPKLKRAEMRTVLMMLNSTSRRASSRSSSTSPTTTATAISTTPSSRAS